MLVRHIDTGYWMLDALAVSTEAVNRKVSGD